MINEHTECRLYRALVQPLIHDASLWNYEPKQANNGGRPLNRMIDPLPEFAEKFYNDDLVPASVVCELFRYQPNLLSKAVAAGRFPTSDKRDTVQGGGRHYWKWSTLLRENKRRIDLSRR